jgi:hypothetical protein
MPARALPARSAAPIWGDEVVSAYLWVAIGSALGGVLRFGLAGLAAVWLGHLAAAALNR